LSYSQLELPVLGTAKWSWTVSKKEAFSILDKFYYYGGRDIDSATNYPINSNPEDYGRALIWLTDWIYQNSITDLRVYLKFGGQNNLGSSETNFESNYIEELINSFISKLDSNLSLLAIHWDNRGKELNEIKDVQQTINLLNTYHKQGFNIGFSGIRYPEIYSNFKKTIVNNWIIQVKENIFTADQRNNYQSYFPDCRYVAYGINKTKNNQNSERAQIFNSFKELNQDLTRNLNIENFFDMCLLFAFCNKSLYGYIIAPSSTKQMVQTINTLSNFKKKNLNKSDRNLIYKKIKNSLKNLTE